ncbi:uncharacterized protein EMH_0054490 [Eimeria mitis]|uniref:Uncharacterized protein n=1 Tax=Eimeria mitis TaxID=44415 RepID=U6K123_9EIME|nr:uncharacterized protein EMH_0054490 [Eimeria mitis]CDJ30012.1 hypothetical protein, conserved [Eimeria mitis]
MDACYSSRREELPWPATTKLLLLASEHLTRIFLFAFANRATSVAEGTNHALIVFAPLRRGKKKRLSGNDAMQCRRRTVAEFSCLQRLECEAQGGRLNAAITCISLQVDCFIAAYGRISRVRCSRMEERYPRGYSSDGETMTGWNAVSKPFLSVGTQPGVKWGLCIWESLRLHDEFALNCYASRAPVNR